MLCPDCKKEGIKSIMDVETTRKMETVVERTRICNICGEKYSTHETVVGRVVTRKKKEEIRKIDKEDVYNPKQVLFE